VLKNSATGLYSEPA